jgi:hypothetical protein
MWPAIPAPCGWIGSVQCARLLALGGQLLAVHLGVASYLGQQLQADDAAGWGPPARWPRRSGPYGS